LLRIDFPRIPFPDSGDTFEALSKLGWGLVQAHLLRVLPQRGLAEYYGKGDHTVDAVRYSPEEQAIWINKTQAFRTVPQAVWGFHIGGYQVIEVSEIAKGQNAFARRNQPRVRHRGRACVHRRSNGENRRILSLCLSRSGITAGARLDAATGLRHDGGDLFSTLPVMPLARSNQADLFETGSQPDLFGAAVAPAYRPNLDKVRARLEKLLAEARAAKTMPWEPAQLSLYRTIFPQMTLFLPEDEAAQFRFAFDEEIQRLIPD